MVASVFELLDVELAREAMAGWEPKGSAKLHWRETQTHLRRAQLVTAVSGLKCEHHHVVIRTAPAEKPERLRAKAMEHLLIELDQRSVSHVIFESRTPKQDQRDLDLLRTLKSLGRLTALTRVDHVKGSTEPLVWIPDIVCGVVADARVQVAPEFRAMLDPKLTEYLI